MRTNLRKEKRLTAASPSKLVAASYVLDVVILIAFGLIGYGFDQLTPRYHPFSILDLTISYPFKADTVSNLNLELSCILAPALIIVIISLGLVPAPTIANRFSTRALWGRKFWELGVGWLGLALAHTTQIMIITGLKSIIGKPRPDMLSRCNPDIANLEQHIVGGYGNAELPGLVLVSQTICQQPSKSLLDDGFRSFPSGHSSTSWAGMLYLTLYLASKLAVSVPILPQVRRRTHSSQSALPTGALGRHGNPFTAYRDEAAAAPLWLLFITYIPLGVAFFIAASRYFDYRHHGFDILSGSLVGILTALFAFRFYHVPLGRGAGWAWGPRSRDRAFGVGIGHYHGYVDLEDEEDVLGNGHNDLEAGQSRTGDRTSSRGLLNGSGTS